MSKLLTYLLVCLLMAFSQAIISDRPCGNVVKFIEQQEDRWFADIVLKDPGGLEGVWLNFTMDTKAQVVTNTFGHAVTLDNKSYQIKRLDYKLKAGEQKLVRLMIKYNGLIAPSIIKVLLNGRSICPGSVFVDENECPPVQTIASDVQIGGRIKVIVEVDVKEVCGTVRVEKDKIYNGLKAEEGHYPWQLALVHKVGVTSTYFCSAGLISQRFALTAGHCVVTKDGKLRPKSEYLIYAGKILLHTNSDNAQVFQVSSINVHPNYKQQPLENDVAILRLHTLADITDYVRPICLPTKNMKLNDLYNKRGLVAGWGISEGGLLVNDLRFARMPIVTPDVCIYSDRTFYPQYISPKVFCAGDKNGTSVCQGDSGAPLVLEGSETGEDRLYIRGIVSLSKIRFGLKCEPKDFAVFTDVASYTPWIRDIVDV